MNSKKLLSISKSALDRFKYLLQKKNNIDLMIKLSLVRKGCNGMSYTINYTDKKNKLDELCEENGIKLILDNKSLLMLIGTEIDYIKDDIREEFVFKNPKAKGNCGCGESFNF